MANVKISALPAVTTVVPGTDVLPLVSNSGATTTKATPQAITNAALLSPGPIGSGTAAAATFTQLAYTNDAPGITTIVTAAGTTTLTNTSTFYQRFTGSTTQTIKLPDETTIPAGTAYVIDNDSTGVITVQDSAGVALATVATGMAGYIYSVSNSAATGNWVGYAYVPGAGPSSQIL